MMNKNRHARYQYHATFNAPAGLGLYIGAGAKHFTRFCALTTRSSATAQITHVSGHYYTPFKVIQGASESE